MVEQLGVLRKETFDVDNFSEWYGRYVPIKTLDLNTNPNASRVLAGALWGDEGETMLNGIAHEELIPTLNRGRLVAQTSILDHSFYSKNLRGMASVEAVQDGTLVDLVCELPAAELSGSNVPQWHNKVASRVGRIEMSRTNPQEYVNDWKSKVHKDYKHVTDGVDPRLLLKNGVGIEREHVVMELSNDNVLNRNRVADFWERNGKHYSGLAAQYVAESEGLTGEAKQAKLMEANMASSKKYAIGLSVADSVYQSLEAQRQTSAQQRAVA